MLRRTLGFLLAMLLLLSSAALAEAPAATASIEEAVANFLEENLQVQIGLTIDGWQRFIYEQGPSEITMSLAKFDITKDTPLAVSFKVAGSVPSLKSLPQYNANPGPWLNQIAEAIAIKNTAVKTSLMISEQNGSYTVQYAPKAEAALQKAIAGIASKAKKDFDSKTILGAVTDYLTPTPIQVPKKAPDSLVNYRPAFREYVEQNSLDLAESPAIPALLYGIKGYKLDVSGGPEHFTFTYSMPSAPSFFTNAAGKLGSSLAYDRRAKNYTTGELSRQLLDQFTKDITAYRHSKAADVPGSYTFSLLDLPQKIDPEIFYDYLQESMDDNFNKALLDVRAHVLLLPDYPALPNPKNGLISGENTGTRCTFKAYDDGYSRCISVYRVGSNRPYSTIFLASGKKATVRIPRGNYYFVIGVGEVWYGAEHLFGDAGGYSKTAQIEVASSKYYHTFTLNPKRDGNTEMYRLSYDDVFGD